MGQPGAETGGLLLPGARLFFFHFHTSLKSNRSSQIPLHFFVKVMEAVTDAGVTQVDEQVAMETATEVADQELTPPAPPKKRLLEMDAEVKTK